jgi:hypothetical protein
VEDPIEVSPQAAVEALLEDHLAVPAREGRLAEQHEGPPGEGDRAVAGDPPRMGEAEDRLGRAVRRERPPGRLGVRRGDREAGVVARQVRLKDLVGVVPGGRPGQAQLDPETVLERPLVLQRRL